MSPPIRLFAIEAPSWGEGPTKYADAFQRSFTAPIALHIERAFAGDLDRNLIALFQVKRLDN
ncbi:hypothetical protein AE618_23675 [Bosea vaviloviae]|uniref:Uncharacterized protein n=1 Tax=Bosea vaviloviae TaxID=1526658 RepID=A0A0N0M8C3_9HYPH|nr:hypothetical protein AE618_23675 [Bosea vaviloviae]